MIIWKVHQKEQTDRSLYLYADDLILFITKIKQILLNLV